MATQAKGNDDGRVTLRGRFRPGNQVRLFKLESDEQLRPHEEQDHVAVKTVDKDGELEFDGLEVGAKYIAQGYLDGFPLEVRLTARKANAAVTDVHAPVTQDEVRTRGGQVLPERGHPLVS